MGRVVPLCSGGRRWQETAVIEDVVATRTLCSEHPLSSMPQVSALSTETVDVGLLC